MAARRTKKPPYGDVKAWVKAGYKLSTAKSEAFRKENYPQERAVDRAIKPDGETPSL
jgi:hypothetical protein